MVSNHSIRRILTVFLASPGDLSEERKYTREVVDKINRVVASSVGWQIDLKGWEDTLPGTGRPQEIINADVDSCDLFLGMLWTRWGSSTGEYSSGFEEEFERAKERYCQSGFPTIWLCFKEVEAGRLADPGDQLKQVLVFREQQIQSKEFLFKNFHDSADWRNKLDEWLLKYVLDLAQKAADEERQESSAQTQNTAIDAPSSDLSGLESAEPYGAAAKEQLLNLTDNVRQFIEPSTSKENLSWLEIARLCLFSKSLVMNHYEDELFTNHEIHLIYQHREQIEVSSDEILPLIKTIANDRDGVKAGWYWFKDSNVSNLLFYIASKIQDSNLLKQILDLLKKASICLTLNNDKRSEIRKFILTSESSENKIDWLSYLGSTGRIDDLSIAMSACNDDDASVRAAADEARTLILARHQPNELLRELIENQKNITQVIIETLKKRISDLNEETLFKSLDYFKGNFKVIFLNEIIARKVISESQLRELIADDSRLVRDITYEAILDLGGKFSLEEIKERNTSSEKLLKKKLPLLEKKTHSILLAYFSSLTSEQLMDFIRSESLGEIGYAYRVLSENHFNCISESIRDDLMDEFSTFLEREILDYKRSENKELLDLYGRFENSTVDLSEVDSKFLINLRKQVDRLEGTLAAFKDLFEQYIKYDFIAAALSGLVLHGNSEDIIWGRKYLEIKKITVFDELLQISAIKLVENYGDCSDVEALIRVSENSFGNISKSAARAAIKLSPGVKGAASQLILTERSNLAFIAVDSFNSEDKSEAFELLEPMLAQDNYAFQSCALLYFLKFSSDVELEELLNRYIQNKYYYRVVCMMDRILYSSSPYKEMYLNEFEAEIKNTYLS